MGGGGGGKREYSYFRREEFSAAAAAGGDAYRYLWRSFIKVAPDPGEEEDANGTSLLDPEIYIVSIYRS